MLSFLRKHAYSWTIRVILGGIVVVFVFWGIGAGFFSQVHPVAVVNGKKILPSEIAEGINEARREIQGTYGPEAASEILKRVNLTELVLSQLIDQTLVLQEAQRLHLRVGDEVLGEVIAQKPIFQRNGSFDRALYLDVLRLNNLEPAQFEESVRTQLTIDLVKSMVMQGVYVSEVEARHEFDLRHQRISLKYIEIPYSDFLTQVHPSEKQIEEYYKQHAQDFREPDRVKVRYIYYDPEKLASNYQPSAAEIEKYYKANLSREFTHPEAVRVRHIFLSASDDPVARADTKARAYALLENLKRGADFAAMARQYSADSGTRAKGGELGFIERGQTVQQFEDAVFKLKPGEISGLIEMPSGFDIAQVEEIRPAHTDPLDSVRDKIVRDLRLQYGSQLAQRYRREDLRKALNGEDLSAIAKQRKLELRETDFFGLGERIPELGVDTTFEQDALKLNKGATAVIKDRNGTPYLVQVVDKKPSYVPSLKDIEERVRQATMTAMAQDEARKKAQKLLESIRAPDLMEQVASQEKLSVKNTGEFDRGSREVPGIGVFPEIAEAAGTEAEVPAVLRRVFEHSGDFYIFALMERKPPSDEQWNKEKAEFIDQLQDGYRQAAWNNFLKELKRSARIEVDTARLAGASGGI